MKLVDLSHPLSHEMPAFPGDPKLDIVPVGRVATHHYNLSRITMSSHTGTHLDAMFHFFDEGRTLDRMPLNWFCGPAHCLRIAKRANEEITEADLRRFEAHLQPEAKVILNTGWHREYGRPGFFEDFPSLTLAAAHYLAARKVRLLGMDLPTPGKQWLELHHILLAKPVEMVLVEALANLDALPDQFTFIGFPLNFQGRDGSPVRAVAWCD